MAEDQTEKKDSVPEGSDSKGQPNNVIPFPSERRRKSAAQEKKEARAQKMLFSFGTPVAALVIAICGVVLGYQFSSPGGKKIYNGREIASDSGLTPDQLRLSPEDQKKLLSEIKNQENARKIASMGLKPTLIEKFQLELLQGRYQLDLLNQKIVGFQLIEGETPIEEPDKNSLFTTYQTIWRPTFDSWELQDTKIEGQNHIVEYLVLKHRSQPVTQVVVKKDLQGRLISVALRGDVKSE